MLKNKQIELLVLPAVQNIGEITKDMNIKVTKSYYSELEFIFKDNQVSILTEGRDINSFSAVWLSSYWPTRDLATAVKQYLDAYNIPTTYTESSTSKITDAMEFSLANILTPDTYYVKDSVALKHISDIEKICKYPMIMKTTKGFGGKNAELITSRKELKEAIENRDQKYKYMFQKYIDNNYDWGVMVVNGKIVSGERSYPKDGEFLNNCSAGATEIFTKIEDIPKEIQEIAYNGAKALGLSWSRADIVVEKTTNKPYLLEINRFPGITKDTTEVSGACEFITNHLAINNLLPNEIPTVAIDTSVAVPSLAFQSVIA